MNKLLLSGVVASSVLLTACGGGSSSTSNSSTPAVNAGTPHVILQGTKAGYEKLAQKNNAVLDGLEITIANKRYPNANNVNLKDFGKGFNVYPYTENVKVKDKSGTQISLQGKGNMYLFQQNYSAIAVLQEHEWIQSAAGKEPSVDRRGDSKFFVAGQTTKSLPKDGKYHYQGQSHHWIKNQGQTPAIKQGEFSYDIDFVGRTGQGMIKTEGNTIALKTASITQHTHKNDDETTLAVFGVDNGVAQMGNHVGKYHLGIFGQNADEVLGHFDLGGSEGFFGGKKQ